MYLIYSLNFKYVRNFKTVLEANEIRGRFCLVIAEILKTRCSAYHENCFCF